MGKIKKIISLGVLATMMATTTVFSGCSSNSSKVTIDMFQFKVEAAKALKQAAKEYEKTHSNVTINIQTVGGGDDYGSALKAKFQSGKEPAIFNIGGPQDAKDWEEKLEDLTDTNLAKKAVDNTLGAVTVKDKVYGLPLALEGYGFIYNKTIFKNAGIDASKIKTFKDLENAAKELDSQKDKLGIESVFVLPAKENWVTGLHTSNVAFCNEFKDATEAFNAKTIDFKYSDQLKEIYDLQAKYAFKPSADKGSINGVDYSTQVEEKFSLGKCAMIQQGNWIYGSIKGIDEKLASNVGILPIPLDGVKEGSIPVGVPMYWAVNKDKDSKVRKASIDFLDWLYTSKKGKKMIINDFNFIPAYSGYESDDLQPKDPLAKDVAKFTQDGKTMPWVFMGYPTGFGEEQFGPLVQKYFSGELTWDQVVDQAKKDWTESRK